MVVYDWKFSYTAKMDVYDYLWDNNKDIAEETLHVPFLEHMQMGDLQADYYVNFMIQDINYLLNVTDILEKMCLEVKCPVDLQVFMKKRFISYKSYAADTLKKFNLKVRMRCLSFTQSHRHHSWILGIGRFQFML